MVAELKPDVKDADIDKQIDSALPKNEREIMHRIMLTLPRSQRFNVMFFSPDGHNYANHLGLQKAMRRAYEVSPGKYQQADAKIVNGPPDQPFSFTGPETKTVHPMSLACQPSASEGASTGAYLRVVSPCGYSDVQGEVTIPCNTEMYNNPGESGYEMFGAWGAVRRHTVDAGLEHYQPNQLPGAPSENLAVFIRYQNGDQSQGQFSVLYYTDPVTLREYYHYGNGYAAHLSCGQTINLAFDIVPDGQINVEADANVVPDSGDPYSGTYEQVTAVYVPPASYFAGSPTDNPQMEWPQNGGGPSGIVLKRFTGLAQNNPPTPNLFNDLSREGVLQSGAPGIEWNNVKIGTTYYQTSDWSESAIPDTRFDTNPCQAVARSAPVGTSPAAFARTEGIYMTGCP